MEENVRGMYHGHHVTDILLGDAMETLDSFIFTHVVGCITKLNEVSFVRGVNVLRSVCSSLYYIV